MRRLNQSGDTIVEVLIAITIASLVLVGAYIATNHNTRAIQDTQEHSQALKLAESQLEYLRGAGSIDTNQHQCFKQDGSGPNTAPADCVYAPFGSGAASYQILITQPAATKDYQVSVTWASLLDRNANISLFYRPPGDK